MLIWIATSFLLAMTHPTLFFVTLIFFVLPCPKSSFYAPVAATPITISNMNANSAMVMMASMLPRQPQFRSPFGSLSDNRQMIKPMSDVKRTDKKKVHPKPILLLAPNNPTNAAKKESVNNPNINSVNPIVLKCYV